MNTDVPGSTLAGGHLGGELMTVMIVIVGGLLFAVWHSFSDALAWRIFTAYYSAERKRITHKLAFIFGSSSRCEYCSAPVPALGLIPVAGFFLMKGRCRACERKLSYRFPVFEGLAAVYGMLLAFSGVTAAEFAVSLIAYLLVWLVVSTDYRVLLIPTEAILGLLILGIVYLLTMKNPHWYEFKDTGLGIDLAVAFVWFFLFHMLRILSGYKMGLADVRLVLALGFLLGHPLALFLPGFAAMLAIGFYLVRRNSILIYAPSDTQIPFGVFLGAGYLLLNLAGRLV